MRRRPAGAVLGLLMLTGAGVAAFPLAESAPAAPLSAGSNQVTAHGDATDLGPASPLGLVEAVVGIAATPSGDGYWLAAADGGVFAYGDAGFFGSLARVSLHSDVVGIAATPSGEGYWLAAADGGVFAFGDAEFLGSTGNLDLHAPIVGIAATPSGDGYWLAAADGGVFNFGAADFEGAAAALGVKEPIVAIAAAPDGLGYWLAGRDGGVFAFGDAQFEGTARALFAPSVTGIAAAGDGYRVVRADGTVTGVGVAVDRNARDVETIAPGVQIVGIASSPSGRGYWLAVGDVPPPPPAPKPTVDPNHPFLVCTRAHESDTSGSYRAVSASGTYRGAYQFSRSTWDSTARHAGRLDLVGVDPAAASPADQDALALHLYHWQGASPWLGRCGGL